MKSNNIFFRIEYYLVLVIAFALSSCYDKTEKDNCLNQVDFTYTLRKSIPLKYVGGINYKTFSFYKNETLCLKDTTNLKVTSLDITIPENDTSFLLNDKSKCICLYTYKNFNNDFVSDTIKTGIVQGILVDKSLWKVIIKVKDFDFEGIISSNEKNNGFRVSFPPPRQSER
jgi:hypothetical protein